MAEDKVKGYFVGGLLVYRFINTFTDSLSIASDSEAILTFFNSVVARRALPLHGRFKIP